MLLTLCEGNSTVTGGFPSQGASNAENVSIPWRHYKNGDHEDVMTCFPHYGPFVRRIDQIPMDSLHKGPVIWSLDFSINVGLNRLSNNQPSYQWLKRHLDAHVTSDTVMSMNPFINTFTVLANIYKHLTHVLQRNASIKVMNVNKVLLKVSIKVFI